MSLDLTNSDMLDCSPFAGEYYNLTAVNIPTTTTTTKPRILARPKPMVLGATSVATSKPATTLLTKVVPTATPIARPIATNVVRNRPLPTTTPIAVIDNIVPSDMNVAPIITPIGTTTTTTTTSTTTPTGAGAGAMGGGGASGGGGGASDGGAESPSEKGVEKSVEAISQAGVEQTVFYKSYWFWGLLIGGVGAYFYAKNKGKKLLPFVLVGSGIGGGAGFLVEKTLGKKLVQAPAKTEAPATTEEQPAE